MSSLANTRYYSDPNLDWTSNVVFDWESIELSVKMYDPPQSSQSSEHPLLAKDRYRTLVVGGKAYPPVHKTFLSLDTGSPELTRVLDANGNDLMLAPAEWVPYSHLTHRSYPQIAYYDLFLINFMAINSMGHVIAQVALQLALLQVIQLSTVQDYMFPKSFFRRKRTSHLLGLLLLLHHTRLGFHLDSRISLLLRYIILTLELLQSFLVKIVS